jgi:hypothetical protein
MSILDTQGLHTAFGLHSFLPWANCCRICSQAGRCSAERTAPGWFHPPCTSLCLPYKHVQWNARTKLFWNCLAGVCHASVTSMQVFESIEWHYRNLHSGILAWGLFFSVRWVLFWGLWLATDPPASGKVIRFATVNSKGESSVVQLVEWLVTLGAQYGFEWNCIMLTQSELSDLGMQLI